MSSQQRQNISQKILTCAVTIAFLWLNMSLYQNYSHYSNLLFNAQNSCSNLVKTLSSPLTQNTLSSINTSHENLEGTLDELSRFQPLSGSGSDSSSLWFNEASPALLTAQKQPDERNNSAALLLVSQLQSSLNNNHQHAITQTKEKALLFFAIFMALLATQLMYLFINRRLEKRKEDARTQPSSSTLLHRTLPKLVENPDSEEPLKTLLFEIELTTNASSSALLLYKGSSNQSDMLICSYAKEEPILISAADSFPENYIPAKLQTHPIYFSPNHESNKILAVELPYDQENGAKALLLLKVDNDLELTEQLAKQLKDHCELLGSMIYVSLFFKHKLRNVQYEERAAIARELHDSIAQSLSYLKIQASRLQSMLHNDQTIHNQDLTQIDIAVQELRESISIAYRHLRELLTTFRLTMDGNSFASAIGDSIKEFEKRCSIVFELDNRLPDGELTVAEEMQLLHIMREALSNVVRHSHAQYTKVSLIHRLDDTIAITIEDDGCGYSASADTENHHGLIIMQERTRSIGGTLTINEREEKGTQIVISFRSAKSHSINSANQNP